ncbi:MAG: hypothetical protein UR12_C0005G0044 [candidate division TM6 bacterium GW2011_GWF2_30_66]|nr:MAG: hypothetical protein UR12_C0005G0044 [candidate division TM6 bacterium GW2011_GWF2_30_66]
MNNNAFTALIDLVDFDQKTIFLQNNIAKLVHGISFFEKQKDTLDIAIQKAKNNLHDIQKEVDLSELEIKSYDQQIKEKQAKLNLITTQKEHASYKKEIQNLQEKQHACEGPLVDSWNALEQAKLEYQKQLDGYESNVAQIDKEITENNKNIEQAKIELQEHIDKRDEKVKFVPKDWLEKYEILGARVADPIVTVDRGSCSACYYDVTPQHMVELKNGKLVQCKGCYRFLYIKQQQEE